VRAFPSPAGIELERLATEAAKSGRLKINAARERVRKANPNLVADDKAWRKEHDWTPYELRHTAAADYAANVGPEAARTMLGHKSFDATAIYAKHSAKVGQDAARANG
jgi:integrase